jgi:hypothetical protein
LPSRELREALTPKSRPKIQERSFDAKSIAKYFASVSPLGGERGTGRQAAGQFVDVAIHDLSNEIKEERRRH